MIEQVPIQVGHKYGMLTLISTNADTKERGEKTYGTFTCECGAEVRIRTSRREIYRRSTVPACNSLKCRQNARRMGGKYERIVPIINGVF